jgi:hypothetical protein
MTEEEDHAFWLAHVVEPIDAFDIDDDAIDDAEAAYHTRLHRRLSDPEGLRIAIVKPLRTGSSGNGTIVKVQQDLIVFLGDNRRFCRPIGCFVSGIELRQNLSPNPLHVK